jgi:hypothetical protein
MIRNRIGSGKPSGLPRGRRRPVTGWRGNPTGQPRRLFYDLSGTADHRDAHLRHALSRLLNWAKTCGVAAIAVEDLDLHRIHDP